MSKINEQVREYISSVLEDDGYLHDESLERLSRMILNSKEEEEHKGYKHNRCEKNPIEMAFYEAWKKENEKIAGLNFGQGVLQDLFYEYIQFPHQRKCVEFINERDRYIVATVIQWLGTNCGMAFLNETLRKVNRTIITINPSSNE